MKDAEIKIRTRLPQDEDFTEFTYRGEVWETGESLEVRYMEGENTGLTETETRISLTDTRMAVERQGKFRSRIEYEKDRKINSIYVTPYGEMEVESDTKYFTLERTSNDLVRVHSEYEMTVAGENQGTTVFYMEIRRL